MVHFTIINISRVNKGTKFNVVAGKSASFLSLFMSDASGSFFLNNGSQVPLIIQPALSGPGRAIGRVGPQAGLYGSHLYLRSILTILLRYNLRTHSFETDIYIVRLTNVKHTQKSAKSTENTRVQALKKPISKTIWLR